MTKRLAVLLAVTTGALALPFIARANEPSRNVGGERGVVFHDARGDARATPRSEQTPSAGWRYVGGEAVWIFEAPGKRAMPERSGPMDRALAPRASERAPMQKAQFANDIYHGA